MSETNLFEIRAIPNYNAFVSSSETNNKSLFEMQMFSRFIF